MHHVKGQKRSNKCAYREKGCKVILVYAHLFPIANKDHWK